jgi:hypothetical protein
MTAAHPDFFGVQVQKGDVKLMAKISTPCSSINLAARVLSSPPDRSPTAFDPFSLKVEAIFCALEKILFLPYLEKG